MAWQNADFLSICLTFKNTKLILKFFFVGEDIHKIIFLVVGPLREREGGGVKPLEPQTKNFILSSMKKIIWTTTV